jgi:type IV secretory pathway VirB10-like protein
MAGKLITLPLRVWLRTARLLTRAAGGAAGRAFSLVRTDDAMPRETHAAPAPRDEPAQRDAPARPPATAPQVEAPARPAPVAPAAPPPLPPVVEEPVHVSEEPELVRETADPGAEDGAGATVTVVEPWNGYAHMNAREVIARARQSGPAELAAVRLYESRHRSRQTVLAAVDRQLKVGNGAGAA